MNERAPRLERKEHFSLQVVDCSSDPQLLGASLSAQTIDISEGGMKLVIYVPLPEGTRLKVETTGDEALLLDGEVRWYQEDDLVHIGVKLDGQNQNLAQWQSLYVEGQETVLLE